MAYLIDTTIYTLDNLHRSIENNLTAEEDSFFLVETAKTEVAFFPVLLVHLFLYENKLHNKC